MLVVRQAFQPGRLKLIGAHVWLVASIVYCGWARAQAIELPAPPQAATPGQRLAMEQIEQLQMAGEFDEALSGLQRLYDQGGSHLAEVGPLRKHSSLTTQRYIPLRQWCQLRTRALLEQQPQLAAAIHQQADGPALAAFLSLQASHDPLEAKRVARRYSLSSSGRELGLLLADLYLERGWSLAALAEVELATPELRFCPPGEGAHDLQDEASWISLWTRTADSQGREQLLQAWKEAHGSHSQQPMDASGLLQALQRMLLAAAIQPALLDHRAFAAWATALAETLPESSQSSQLLSMIQESAQWPILKQAGPWTTFAGNDARAGQAQGKYDLSIWPNWQLSVEGFGTSSDRTNASRPRVGESDRHALPYHPLVYQGKVFVHELNRIRAYDLQTGKPWPEIEPAIPLFDSHINASSYLPLGYPMVGVPRGTLSIHEDCLYARLGSPVTGWANRDSVDSGRSSSYLVGLDLQKQGSLLRGFPLYLDAPEFLQAEFEGCPLACGDLLVVAVVERDNVGLRRSVVAFDRRTGQLVWRSAVLAAGVVDGSDRANLINHQLLTYAGGRLFYNTNLGSIVCLDPLSGETEWLVRYARNDQQQRSYSTPDRFRYRDLTPCMVAGGKVFCMPQDCGELFALNATDGRLLWSTDDSLVADAIHLLGIVGDNLIVSGDRLVWLDCNNGSLLGRFPASTTPGMAHALPSPRGLGRGAIVQQEVVWPTAAEVFFFDGQLPRSADTIDAPPIKRRFHVGSRGSAGGNLCIAENYLIFSGSTRIMAFKSLPDPSSNVSQK